MNNTLFIVSRYLNTEGDTRFTVSLSNGAAGPGNHTMSFIASLTPKELMTLQDMIAAERSTNTKR